MKHLKLFLSLILILGMGLNGCKKSNNTNLNDRLHNVSNLIAIADDSEITLKWDNPAEDNFSHIEITFAPQNDKSQPIIVPSSESSKTIDGLQNGKEYSFIIIARGTNGKTSLGLGIKATPAEQEDSVPDSTGTPQEPTSGTFSDQRDDHEYKWVKIGDQVWMAENLSFLPPESTFSAVKEGSNVTDFIKYYYIYGFDAGGNPGSDQDALVNRAKYGIMYNWYAAIGLPDNVDDTIGLKNYLSNHKVIQGVAPEGWHIPSDSEYMILEKYLGMQESELVKTNYRGPIAEVGKQLKTSVGWKTNKGTDKVGFSLLPSGRWKNGKFEFVGEYAYIWTSSLSVILIKNGIPQARAWLRYAKYDQTRMGRFDWEHFNGYAIRCIKDE